MRADQVGNYNGYWRAQDLSRDGPHLVSGVHPSKRDHRKSWVILDSVFSIEVVEHVQSARATGLPQAVNDVENASLRTAECQARNYNI